MLEAVGPSQTMLQSEANVMVEPAPGHLFVLHDVEEVEDPQSVLWQH